MSKQFLKFGVPFIAIVVGGTLFLTQMSQAKYERHDRGIELAKVNRPTRPPPKFELEKELEKLEEQRAFTNWDNKRVPRKPGDYE